MNFPESDESLKIENDTRRADGPPALDETMQLQGDTSPVSISALRDRPEKWIGRQLGKYEITSLLGVGGMGVVLKAHDPSIERDVAIKVLPAELSADETTLHRFLAEAKSAGKLNHPNTVTIYEVAHEADVHYLVMEIVSGGSAADHLERVGPYNVSEATQLVIEACKGLAAAHGQHLVHRDIKPANLLLTQDGAAKVADFGLAKQTEMQSMMMTREGHLVGTPYYMSPEQCQGLPVDARSDVYSLGATYYSLLTGKCPFQDTGSVVQVMFAHCNAGPPDPREVRATVPAACAAIIQRAMAKRPEERYASMDEMRVDLEAVLAAMSGTGIQLPSQSSASLVRPATLLTAGSRRRFNGVLIACSAVLAIAGASAAFFFLSGATHDIGQAESIARTTSPNLPVGATPSGKPVKVGVLHSLSGTTSVSESAVVDATLFAIEEINQSGGVLGRPVKAVVADGRSNEATFAGEAQRLIIDEQVCTVFGCWTSASRKAVRPIVEEHDHLLIYPLRYEGLESSPNIIYLGAAPNQQILPAVEWAVSALGKKRFFLVGSDSVFPLASHEIIKDDLQRLGAEVVGEQYLPMGSSDVEPLVAAIQQSQPDMILNIIIGDSNIAFFRELREAGIRSESLPCLSFSVDEQQLKSLSPAKIAGDYSAWPYFETIASPANEQFVLRFHDKFPQRRITDPMQTAYAGVKMWAAAVQEAGSLDPSAIRRAMQHQRLDAPEGSIRIDPETQHCFKTPRIGQADKDGRFQVVWTATAPVAPDPYPNSRSSEAWRGLLNDLYSGWGDRWTAPGE